ncbi:MAG: alpha/beta hydrolase [Chloroflexota bacterium]
MTAAQVEVPGGRLFVLDEGAGPPIVLIHAGVADLRSWDSVVPPLTAAGYRVVRYDNRGYGASTTEDLEYSRQADLIAVLDARRIGRAALVGNSMGGSAAIDTAIEHPERVVALVGVAAGLGGFEVEPTPAEKAIFEAYEQVDAADPFDQEALTDFEVRVWLDGPGQQAGRVDATIREAMRAMAAPLNTPGRIRGTAVPLDPPANDRLAGLRCPVLAVTGRLDFSDVTAAAERLAVTAPDGKVVIWDDVAHMIGMEQPDRLAATIVDFLGPLERWA